MPWPELSQLPQSFPQHPVDICLNPKDYEIFSRDNNFLYGWMFQRKVVALAEIFPIQSSIM